jgi:V8-like Glu-specific endopeptidase
MQTVSMRCIAVVAVFASAVGCSQAVEDDDWDSLQQGKVIGTNDLVPVVNDGANIPSKYAPLIDAFGLLKMGCTATHIGDGIAVTAGHCFNAPSQRKDKVPCSGITVRWGLRKDKAAYMTSTCSIILAEQTNSDRDYAIFRVDPVPPVHIDVDHAARPPVDTPITIFGHPQGRPLEWSNTCLLKPASSGGWGLDHFSHQCDTEPGSSGSSVLDDVSLKVIGIHDGGTTKWNYATYLADTPIAELLADARGEEAGSDPADGDGPVIVTP